MDPRRDFFAWVKVTSSNVDSIAWRDDLDTGRPILGIRFRGGNGYHFSGVPERLYYEMLQAPSKGTYFNQNIKGRYRFTQVEGAPPKGTRKAKR